MNLRDFTTDPATGYSDIPEHYPVCDQCGEVEPVTMYGDQELCVVCAPKCTLSPGCHEPQDPRGEAGGCTVHELDSWIELQNDPQSDDDERAEAREMIALLGA